jgi:NADPH:quinone reductase-like Zn-dependent oxidoreductase
VGIVVWGAGSAVGGYAVQLAKKAGLYVVAIAGSSTQHAKDLGADEVISYKTDDVASAIEKAAQKVSIAHAYDAISEPPTTETLVKALGKLKGGIITTVLPTEYDSEDSSSNVKVVRTMVGQSHEEQAEFAQRWIRQIARWVDEGSFEAGNVKVIPGGLDGVKEGLRLLEEGKVNATKLVCECEGA